MGRAYFTANAAQSNPSQPLIGAKTMAKMFTLKSGRSPFDTAAPIMICVFAVATVALLASGPPRLPGMHRSPDVVIALGAAIVLVVLGVALKRGLTSGAGLALLAGAAIGVVDLVHPIAAEHLIAVLGGLLATMLGLALYTEFSARRQVGSILSHVRRSDASHTLNGALEQLDSTLGELNSSNQQLQLILDNQPGCTLVLDEHGRLSVCGGRALELLGRIPERGLSLSQALAQAGVALGHPLQDMLEDGLEVEHRGRRLWLRQAEVRGEAIGAVVSILDVTALRRAVDARAATLRFISHDIRSPLNSIIALSDLHEHDHEAFVQCGGIPHISRLAHYTLSMGESYIGSDADAGLLERRFAPFDLRQVGLDVARRAQPKAMVAQVRLDCSSCFGPALYINGMRDMVTRMLQNLVDNAVHASGPGKTVWITLERVGHVLHLRVRDEAGGLSGVRGRQHLTNLADWPARAGGRGFGMGLKISAHVIALHGGTFAFDTQEGQGTEVTVSLPWHRAGLSTGGLQ